MQTRIGLVGCSQEKLPVLAPAWLLYSASPRFSQAFQTARAECACVFILSARWGLLDPETVVEPYNCPLAALSLVAQKQWGIQVSQRLHQRVSLPQSLFIGYASEAYLRPLAMLHLTVPYSGGLYAKAKAMGRHSRLRRIDWPMHWLLEYCHTTPQVTYAMIARELQRRGYAASTVSAQMARVRHCPLYYTSSGYLRLRYPSPTTHEVVYVDPHQNVSL